MKTESTASHETPEGFAPLFRQSPFTSLLGPVYSRGHGLDLVIGLRVLQKHCNARGFAHGGVICTLADLLLGYSCSTSRQPPLSAVTVHLDVDLLGIASVGDWLEAALISAEIGPKLIFAHCNISTTTRQLAVASAVFAISNEQ